MIFCISTDSYCCHMQLNTLWPTLECRASCNKLPVSLRKIFTWSVHRHGGEVVFFLERLLHVDRTWEYITNAMQCSSNYSSCWNVTHAFWKMSHVDLNFLSFLNDKSYDDAVHCVPSSIWQQFESVLTRNIIGFIKWFISYIKGFKRKTTVSVMFRSNYIIKYVQLEHKGILITSTIVIFQIYGFRWASLRS